MCVCMCMHVNVHMCMYHACVHMQVHVCVVSTSLCVCVQAGGCGLNLIGGNRLILFDPGGGVEQYRGLVGVM
jgi:hypothetical protein